MNNNYRRYDCRQNYSNRYEDSGTCRRDEEKKKENTPVDKSWKITTEMPILDLLSLFVGIISLAITIFIATGIIGIHQTVQNIDEDNDDDGSNNNGRNNNGSNNNNNNNKNKTNSTPSSSSKTHTNKSLLTEFETKIADWFNRRKI